MLDADDAFLPDRLARLVPRAEALGADLLADNLRLVDFETGESLGRVFQRDALEGDAPLPLAEIVRRDMPDMIGRTNFGFAKPIIRREFLDARRVRYHEDIHADEDFVLYFECIARGGRFHLEPEIGYVYSLRQGSISGRRASLLHVSRGNRRMQRMAAEAGDSAALAVLRRRQALLDFDCFKLLLEQRKWWTSLGHLRSIPPGYMARRLSAAAGRRIADRDFSIAGRDAL